MILFTSVIAAVVVALVWTVYQLTVQSGRLMLRLEKLERSLTEQGLGTGSGEDWSGLPLGAVLNEFELARLGGGKSTLSEWRGQRLLVIFVSPACEPCRHLLLGLAGLRHQYKFQPILISTGSVEENRRLFEPLGLSHPVLLQRGNEVAKLYRTLATPSAYVVDENLMTASPLLVGAEKILRQLEADQKPDSQEGRRNGRAYSRSLAGSRLERDGLAAGTAAPVFTLPRLEGGELSLSSLRGKSVLLTFSDPNCGPCDELAPKLEQVHRRSRDLQVLMVSRGDPEANRRKATEHHLTFPIVLQKHWEISREFGMFATPIGYLIDPDGVLATGVLVGAEAIMKAAVKPAAAMNLSRRLTASA